ncbi:MAG: hypothetical protein LUG54_05290 [Clostridiales bacterium]|nr:hypothetical protein [Clostridiales bacterium]
MVSEGQLKDGIFIFMIAGRYIRIHDDHILCIEHEQQYQNITKYLKNININKKGFMRIA